MKELIDHIPFLDVMIVGLLAFLIYIGWKHGFPRLTMTIGAIYTGFLLSSIYYHLFAVTFTRMLNMKSGFAADFIGFLGLDLFVTVLMMVLLFSLFGHISIRGRLAVFDKLGGAVTGFMAGVFVLGILISLLRLPHELSKQKLDPSTGIAAVELFNDGFDRSALAPAFMKGAPMLLTSVKPMLPPETREKGVVPLLKPLADMQQGQ